MKSTKKQKIYKRIILTTVFLGVVGIFSPENIPLIGPLFSTISRDVKKEGNYTGNYNPIPVTIIGIERTKTPLVIIKIPGYEGLAKLSLTDSYDPIKKRVSRAEEKLKILEQNLGGLIWIPLAFETQERNDMARLWTFRKGKMPAKEVRIISEKEYLDQNVEIDGAISLNKGYGQIRGNPTTKEDGLELVINTSEGEFNALLTDSSERVIQRLKDRLIPGIYIEFSTSSKDQPPKLYFNEGYVPAHLVNPFTIEERTNLPKKRK